MEKMAKYWAAYQSGRVNYPLGLVSGGKAFSPEQALLDLETAVRVHGFGKGIPVEDTDLETCLEIIRRKGIGGNSLEEAHTLENMRKVVWYPTLMDRKLSSGYARDQERDMLANARVQYHKVMKNAVYEIDSDRRHAIEDVVRRAERALCV